MLLALVFGIVLVLVGVTTSALVAVATSHLRSSTLNAVISRDASLVELFVNGNLDAADLDEDGPSSARADELRSQLDRLATEDGILRIEIRDLAGRVLASDAAAALGLVAGSSPGWAQATAGIASASLVELDDEASEAVGPPLVAEHAVEAYLPIVDTAGKPIAVVGLWRDAGGLVADLDSAGRDVMLVTLVAGVLLASVLFLVFRASQTRLTGQHRLLLEATRRDALTGMLNHGRIVELLVDEVEAARLDGGRIGLALLDVDNFRLFNTTHGHAAADEVLSAVARLVTAEADGGHVARYGPDEFLLVRPGVGASEMEASAHRMRASFDDITVQFGESERLPVSASVGICGYPEHAASATDLLSMAALALAEAKASGGNGIRVARLGEEKGSVRGSFDVLQGLVLAVDTKDRYTKRHSEDVARYAVFLAQRLGFDEDFQRILHLAGLLHDVGKIGIPDVILRKPSSLTTEEYGMFHQHVALGDSIVRDVPNVDLVRAGIRYHHERWDGTGYIEGLAGEDIPLVARIISVADAYSAMTTTRPYRKALAVDEALRRLRDAAGMQLQPELVDAFVEGVETIPDAPAPGETPVAIWRPELSVA